MAQARALLLALAFGVGVLAGERFVSASVAASAALVGLCCVGTGWFLHRRSPKSSEGLVPVLSPLAAFLVVVGVSLCGFAAMSLRMDAVQKSALKGLAGRVHVVDAVAVSDPRAVGRGRLVRLDVKAVDGAPLDGRAQLMMFGPGASTLIGDRIRVEAKLEAVQPDDAFTRSLLRQGIVVRMSASSSDVRLVSRSSNPFLSASTYMRAQFRKVSVARLGREDGPLLTGFVFGDTDGSSEEMSEAFRASGLAHLTAVSGANLAVLIAAAAFVISLAGGSRRMIVSCGLALIAFFVVVTRWEPSVLRAALMSGAAMSALFFGRRSYALHALGIAALVLLAVDPSMLWSIGFQLSFAATLGILALSADLERRMKRLPTPIAQAAAVAIAAQLAVTPLVAFHFGRVSLVSIAANIAAFPMAAPAMVFGLIGASLASIWAPLGVVPVELAGLFVTTIRKIAVLAASVPSAELRFSSGSMGWLLIGYLVVTASGLILLGRKRAARWALMVATLGLVIVALIPVSAAGPPEDSLRITFFDVGQGDAAMIESPTGVRILIDGGPDEHLLSRKLRARGISRVDAVVFSHEHADHTTGLIAPARRLSPSLILHPGVAGVALRSLSGSKVEVAEEGERFVVGDVSLLVAGPADEMRTLAVESSTASAGTGEGTGVNDASIVLRVGWGRGCVLFTGDVEEQAQLLLAERRSEELDCTLMKAPHHGSGRIEQRFVEASDPEWVSISVGRNDYGHPSAKALRLFEAQGARVLRTDTTGDVVVSLFRDGTLRVV